MAVCAQKEVRVVMKSSALPEQASDEIYDRINYCEEIR
jgi:hypothetical protein